MTTAVPILDISPLVTRGHEMVRDGTSSVPESTISEPRGSAVASAMHEACLRTGFFVVTGHGLDAEMAAVFAAARQFFDAPQQRKERTPRVNRYGYVPRTDDAIDRTRQSGVTEFLEVGLADEVPLPDLPGFADAVRAYQLAAIPVAAVLLRELATSLGAPVSFFEERMTRPQCRLRFLHYSPMPLLPDGTLAVPTSPHTDYGLLTLLATDGVPGLEVQPIGGEWTPVDAPAGSLVINLGDMLARWTNDVYRSTPHRVVASTDRHRLSIPFFVNPDPDTIVECIESCVSEQRPRRYEPIRAGEYLTARIDGTIEPYIDAGTVPARRAPRADA